MQNMIQNPAFLRAAILFFPVSFGSDSFKSWIQVQTLFSRNSHILF